MSKAESEQAIRHLCHVWAETLGPVDQQYHYSFLAFTRWLEARGYGHYLEFRSVRSARADAELWFDQEFAQTWRN